MCVNHFNFVSLLRTLSKVFDKIMYDSLPNFVNKFGLLHNRQYGTGKTEQLIWPYHYH